MIEVKNLSKNYGSTVAITNIFFTVKQGEILGLLGPNGAGKTTTMRILAGAILPSQGTAKIAGFDIYKQAMNVKKHLGYLPENPPLYPNLKVKDFLDFVARIKGVSKSDRQSQINRVIERCQLQEYSQVLIRKLSRGYRQRVGIAQALVHNPSVIILDEPTVGLDPLQIIEMRELIKSLAGEHTVILSSHILSEVSMICDRVTIINQGRVVTTDSLNNLMLKLSSTFTYQLELEGNIAELITSLEKIPGIAQIAINPQSNQNRKIIEINCLPHYEPGAEIAEVILREGIKLYEMRRDRPSLEEIFLSLTNS